MATSTVPAVLDALKTILDARAGLIGPPKVEVYTAGMGDDMSPESITFFGADPWSQEWAVMPYTSTRGKSEEFTIKGQILIYKQGAGNAVAKVARDRAYAIAAEVEGALRLPAGSGPTLGGLVAGAMVVAFKGGKFDQGFVPGKGRVASITFDLDCKYRI